MKTDATQQGASEQLDSQNSGAGEEVAQQPSARELAMESIAVQRRQSLADEGVDIEAEPAAPSSQQDDQLASQLRQDDRPTHAPADMRVKVKVDGEELDLPLSEVVKSYQKDSTASKRLQEATRILALAETQASKVAQNEKPESNTDIKPDPAAQEERRGRIKDAFSKLYEGDEEGAVEAMMAFVGEGAQQATQPVVIDTVAIAAQVRQQLDVESAYSDTRLDYPELFADTERGVVLGTETLSRMNAKEAQGIPRSQAMQQAAQEVAALFGIQKAGRQQDVVPSTARDTKLARKAGMDNVHSANVVAGSQVAPAEAQNVSSVIQEMAKARLGQSLSSRS